MNQHGFILWWDRLVAMTIKELKQLIRDPVLLLIISYFFTVDVYMAGSGINLNLRNASVMVIDHDHSAASRELIYRFRQPYFDFKGEIFDTHTAESLLDQGRILAVLDIPENFQRHLLQGQSVAVQFQVDSANTVLGTLATSYATEITAGFSQDFAAKRLGPDSGQRASLPVIQNRYRVLYNPNQIDGWFMSISELLTVTTMLAMMLPAAAAVREKERGTIEQLAVSPLSSLQILLPKVISMGLVILLGVAVSLFLIIIPVFDLPVKGSLGLFFTVTGLYVFTASGIGLFVATISRSLAQVTMLVILLMMPILLLSGAWTPPEAMPQVMRWAMKISPLYYFNEMSYAILLKGAGVRILWDSLLGLALLGAVFFNFGVWRFRRQFG
ncbi:ABC transporter permease [Methylicorpusculum oleiharenae]|uniref:ABC transporter permease n=1 Tax=Methylicorpusculum oleiharenae TaxID=1338687 RepID=UPI0013599BD8|nr:ABC transporter permease [Methylicorpusculum oleiharenae]MCD2450394.1 ABC transporter permease [Methylicorpusculum oleiharenae]